MTGDQLREESGDRRDPFHIADKDKEADLGIAGGNGVGILMKKGEIIKKVPEEELLKALEYELKNWSE